MSGAHIAVAGKGYVVANDAGLVLYLTDRLEDSGLDAHWRPLRKERYWPAERRAGMFHVENRAVALAIASFIGPHTP